MISNELAGLADWVLGYCGKQVPIPVEAAASLAQCLMDYSRQARQLERLPVNDTALVLNDVCND